MYHLCRVHLTNDAVQSKYEKTKDENKMTRDEFEEYIANNGKSKSLTSGKDLYENIKSLVRISAEVVKDKLNSTGRSHGFELTGYDFMLDEDLKPYLIEVNSNPSLEEQCEVMKRLIPDLLESTFRVAVDPTFTPPVANLTRRGLEAVEEMTEKGDECRYERIAIT